MLMAAGRAETRSWSIKNHLLPCYFNSPFTYTSLKSTDCPGYRNNEGNFRKIGTSGERALQNEEAKDLYYGIAPSNEYSRFQDQPPSKSTGKTSLKSKPQNEQQLEWCLVVRVCLLLSTTGMKNTQRTSVNMLVDH